jgi:large subunit ribosomal protein L10
MSAVARVVDALRIKLEEEGGAPAAASEAPAAEAEAAEAPAEAPAES